ncbi:hypothetical protein Tco_0524808 [Tanacetum coccineum]
MDLEQIHEDDLEAMDLKWQLSLLSMRAKRENDLISQDFKKFDGGYVTFRGGAHGAEILKKFNYTDVKSASTLVDLEKPLVKDGDADVDVDNLKGKPTLGLWYSRDSPFELVAYTDSDYAGATQDRKSTTGGCQFLGNRLISWQCKKQTVVATSTTEAEYVAAASCCGQVLWIQNQLLDYGYNFMNTVINIDNNSTICIIENPVQHSKTKHIEIRHHFIRDCNAKKLIQMVKIHTDYNVADLLTKGFDAGRHVKRGPDTKIPQSSGPPVKVGDTAVHKKLGDRMERVATTASSLEAEQDNVGRSLKRTRSGACIAQSTASMTISSTAWLTLWGILRFSKLYSLVPCSGRDVVVVIIEVVDVDVGNEESDSIVVRSITGVVIGGTEEVS